MIWSYKHLFCAQKGNDSLLADVYTFKFVDDRMNISEQVEPR